MKKYLPYKAGTREIIDSLISEYQWLDILKAQNNAYNPVLDYLIDLGKIAKNDPDGCYNRECSKIKTIEAKTQLSSSKIRNWIFKIYEDLLVLNADHPTLFANEGYHHILAFESNYGYFSPWHIRLPYRLNLYDGFMFPLIKAKVQDYYFYVRNIYLQHYFGECISNVRLQGGYANTYPELIYDKADFLGALSLNNQFDQTDYVIDNMLRQYSQQGRIIHPEPEQKYGRKREIFNHTAKCGQIADTKGEIKTSNN